MVKRVKQLNILTQTQHASPYTYTDISDRLLLLFTNSFETIFSIPVGKYSSINRTLKYGSLVY